MASKNQCGRVLAYNNLGLALHGKGDIADAIIAYKKAMQLNPKEWRTYNNLAIAHYLRKDYDSAWKVIMAARNQGLDKMIRPRFIQALEKDSGRKK